MKEVKFSWGCIGAGSAILLFIAALANNVRHDTNMAGAADAVLEGAAQLIQGWSLFGSGPPIDGS